MSVTISLAFLAFLWTFGDGTAVLLSSLLLLLLFSDLPKMTPVTPYQLIRTTKKKWLLAQFLYVVLVTVLYTVLMLFFTSVLCMQNSYSGNLWSETAAMLGYSSLGKNLQVPSTVRVMESISPYGCKNRAQILRGRKEFFRNVIWFSGMDTWNPYNYRQNLCMWKRNRKRCGFPGKPGRDY